MCQDHRAPSVSSSSMTSPASRCSSLPPPPPQPSSSSSSSQSAMITTMRCQDFGGPLFSRLESSLLVVRSSIYQLQDAYKNKILPLWLFLTGPFPVFVKNICLMLLTVLAFTPGACVMAWYYWISSNRKSFRYGKDSMRQQIDVFPSLLQQSNQNNNTQQKQLLSPTVLFCCGGAWIIGMNAFGAFMARVLTAAGITVVIADYRNYPVASIPSQVDDVEAAIQWTVDNVKQAGGGDPDKLVVVGESAGGHLLLMAMLRKALRVAAESSSSSTSTATAEQNNNKQQQHSTTIGDWQLSDIKGFVAMALPVNFTAMEPTFEKHKWDETVREAVFGGQFHKYDPTAVLLQRRNSQEHDLDACQPLVLPPMRVFHGTHDDTVPLEGVQVFCNELKHHIAGQQQQQHAGGGVELYTIPNFRHTYANMQGPFRGDYTFQRHVFAAVQEWVVNKQQGDDNNNSNSNDNDNNCTTSDLQFPHHDSVLLKRLCPEALVELGTQLMPF